MDIASIEKLIALVEASGIGELEIAEGASSVRYPVHRRSDEDDESNLGREQRDR